MGYGFACQQTESRFAVLPGLGSHCARSGSSVQLWHLAVSFRATTTQRRMAAADGVGMLWTVGLAFRYGRLRRCRAGPGTSLPGVGLRREGAVAA